MAFSIYFLFFNVTVLSVIIILHVIWSFHSKRMQWSTLMQSEIHCFKIISVTIIRDSVKRPQPSINTHLGINATCCHVAHHVNPWRLETDSFSRSLDTNSISILIITHKHFIRHYLSVAQVIKCPFIFCNKTNKASKQQRFAVFCLDLWAGWIRSRCSGVARSYDT
jgi:hypothetical protein